MENFSQRVSKSVKTLKIRKKKTFEISSTKEDSFIDEDPAHFFTVTEDPEENRLAFNDIIASASPRNYVGPLPVKKPQRGSHTNEVKKGLVKGATLRMQHAETVDYKQKFNDILISIEKNKAASEAQERVRLSHLSPREKVVANRQKRIMDKFQKNNKHWNAIQRNLSEKTMKSTDKLLSTIGNNSIRKEIYTQNNAISNIQEGLFWYLNLRTNDPEKSNIYLSVGSPINELYTFVKGRKSDQETFLPKSEDLNELQVIGIGKLGLEIDAVKLKGPENLNPNLIDKVECDETIAEQYDMKVLAGKL